MLFGYAEFGAESGGEGWTRWRAMLNVWDGEGGDVAEKSWPDAGKRFKLTVLRVPTSNSIMQCSSSSKPRRADCPSTAHHSTGRSVAHTVARTAEFPTDLLIQLPSTGRVVHTAIPCPHNCTLPTLLPRQSCPCRHAGHQSISKYKSDSNSKPEHGRLSLSDGRSGRRRHGLQAARAS